jgi:hypothetical protein
MTETAESLGIPATFNGASWFIDRHVAKGVERTPRSNAATRA